MRRRERVLVVTSSNGWVEVYANRRVDVVMVNRIHATGDAETAHTLDRLVELSIPRSFRDIYWPQMLRKAMKVEKILPEAALQTLHDVQLLRRIQEKEPCFGF